MSQIQNPARIPSAICIVFLTVIILLTSNTSSAKTEWKIISGKWIQSGDVWKATALKGKTAIIRTPYKLSKGRVETKIKVEKYPKGRRTVYIAFDYKDKNNYKFAGMSEGKDLWIIGEVIKGKEYYRTTYPDKISAGVEYNVKVELLPGNLVKLYRNNKLMVEYAYTSSILDRYIHMVDTDVIARIGIGVVIPWPFPSSSPMVADIPSQIITSGETFTPIHLDDYVYDSDHSDNELIWSYSGNRDLSVFISPDRIATVTVPGEDWAGQETIGFIATDPDANTGRDSTVFAVYPSPTNPQISIDEGESTVSRTIHLSLSANGATEMIISENEDFSGAEWGYFNFTKEFLLSEGEGLKTVYVKYRNPAYTETESVSDSITLRAPQPSSITIDEGESTNNSIIHLSLFSEDAIEMAISENEYFDDVLWEGYAESKQWVLSSEDGLKIVCARFRDGFGNVTDIVSDFITFMKEGNYITIDEGGWTNHSAVTVRMHGEGITEVMLSENEDFSRAVWEPYEETKLFILSEGDGKKTIYARFTYSKVALSDSAATIIKKGPKFSNMFVPKMQPAIIDECGVQVPQYSPNESKASKNTTITEYTNVNVVTGTVTVIRDFFNYPIHGSEMSLSAKLVFTVNKGWRLVYGPQYSYLGDSGLWINSHYLIDGYGNKFLYTGWPEDLSEDAYSLAINSPECVQARFYEFKYHDEGSSSDSSYYEWITRARTRYVFSRYRPEYLMSYRLTSKSDRLGNWILYGYDENNRLTGMSANNGKSIGIGYDESNKIRSISSGGVRYDLVFSPGRLSINGPNGYHEEFEYFKYNRRYYLSKRVDSKGNEYIYNYIYYYPSFVYPMSYVRLPHAPGDEQMRVSEVNLPNGTKTTLHYTPGINYDIEAKTTEVVDCNGNRSLYVYYFKYDPLDPYNPWDQLYESNIELVFEKRVFLGDISLERDRPISVTFRIGLSPVTPYDSNSVSVHYNYDDGYSLRELIDYNGNVTNWVNDIIWGNVLQITDSEMGIYSYDYDPVYHKRIWEQDPLGRETNYSIDGVGNILSKTDANGNITRYSYDLNGNVTSVTDSRSNTTNYEYDTEGNVIKKIDPYGNETNYTYDYFGNVLTEQDARGNTNSYQYDDLQRLVEINYPDEVNHIYQYDSNSNKISETDGNDNTTQYSYDNLDRLTSIIDPLSNPTQYFYDGVGNKIRELDANNHEAQYEYDKLNRIVKKTDAIRNETIYEYIENFGSDVFEGQEFKPNSVTDARGNTAEYVYDRLYRLCWKINPYSRAIEYGYDAVGNKLYKQNHAGYRTGYAYDNLNRMTTKTDQLGNVTAYGYDSVGNLTEVTDANGNIMNYSYDNLNRIYQAEDVLGGRTIYSYDPVSNVTSIEKPNSSRTEFGYDSRNRLEYVKDKLDKYTYFEYDGVGNRTQRRDPNGNIINYQYDPRNLLINESSEGDTITYTYDPVGNRTYMNDSTGTTTYNYDALNRIKKVTYPNSKYIEYGYDSVGNRTSMRDSDGESTEYEYNALNQINSIIDPEGNTTAFEYDTLERRVRTNYPNGITLEYWYDEINRILSKKHIKSNEEAISWLAYEYDNVGNRVSMYDVGANKTTTYGYDSLYRLTNVSYPDIYDVEYAYDSVGNRLIETNTLGDEYRYTYNTIDQLLQKEIVKYRNEPVSDAVIAYQYDNNGNLIQRTKNYELEEDSLSLTPDQITSYTWDYNNQLTQVTLPDDSNYGYTYSGDGIRTQKQAPAGTEQYLYDGLNILKDLDEAGNTLVSYTQELDLDQLISLKETGSFSEYYHTDVLGSVRVITDGSEGVVKTYDYDAWGNVVSETGDSDNQYKFTGRRDETEETGLMYYRARYYDPDACRFISQDPFTGGPDDARIGYSNNIFEAFYGGISLYTSFRQAHRFNRYVYCENNPVSFIDPLGLEIKLTSHKVAGIYWRHLAILIIPEDQKTWQENKNFKKTSDGKIYMTISAGEEDGRLKSDLNRKTDAPNKNRAEGDIKFLKGMCENDYIKNLLRADRNYEDKAKYKAFPGGSDEFYNSNSYITGIVNVTGGEMPKLEGNYPGAKKSLPRKYFKKRKKKKQ